MTLYYIFSLFPVQGKTLDHFMLIMKEEHFKFVLDYLIDQINKYRTERQAYIDRRYGDVETREWFKY